MTKLTENALSALPRVRGRKVGFHEKERRREGEAVVPLLFTLGKAELPSNLAASRGDRVAAAVRGLVSAGNVGVDIAAVEAGLAFLDAGGDFADGIIAHEGQWLGGEIFVSFDRAAVRLLQANGVAARLAGAAH